MKCCNNEKKCRNLCVMCVGKTFDRGETKKRKTHTAFKD